MSNIDSNEGWIDNPFTVQERLKIMREKFSTNEEDLRDDKVFSDKTGLRYNVVNSWQNAKGNLAKKTRAKICNALGLKYDVWTAGDYTSYDVQRFFNELDTFMIEVPSISLDETMQDSQKLDRYILGAMVEMSVQEEDELTFYTKDKMIDLPANLEKYSSRFIFNLAQQLKSKGQAKDALYALDTLQAKKQNFKYIYRKEIEHLKAILLSEKSIQRWDDAIEVLRYLYADRYHLDIPEIVTLTASNYKRKAFYHPNGMLNHPEYVDLDALSAALSLYYEGLALKSTKEKYYDAVNIAYVESILDEIEDDESEESTQKRIKKLFNDVYDNTTPDMKDWWEVTTLIEFYILLGDDACALDTYESYEGTPSRFELETTIRQLEIYVHFCDDSVAKSFLDMLRKNLSK